MGRRGVAAVFSKLLRLPEPATFFIAQEFQSLVPAATRCRALGRFKRIKALERENRELRKANEILRLASAYFAQAELDRRNKP